MFLVFFTLPLHLGCLTCDSLPMAQTVFSMLLEQHAAFLLRRSCLKTEIQKKIVYITCQFIQTISSIYCVRCISLVVLLQLWSYFFIFMYQL
uniref:Secreted protein n=1 Tax=Ixodes ricinus TaxID=34613 RepID=A0A6B0UH09_IXORI